MRRFLTIILIAFSGLVIYYQFKPIKESSIFLDDFFLSTFFLSATCLFTLTSLIRSIKSFKQQQRFVFFLPAIAGLASMSMVFAHRFYRSQADERQILFQAMNYDIGTDGGFTFEFKKDGYLKGLKNDRLSTTYYWGRYKRQADTLLLDIQLDFKLGRVAYVQGGKMHFKNDTTMFEVSTIQPLLTQDW
jgi:hypothetical protein